MALERLIHMQPTAAATNSHHQRPTGNSRLTAPEITTTAIDANTIVRTSR